MSRQHVFAVGVIILLSLAGGAWAGTAFELVPTFDVEIGNDASMGPTASSEGGSGMGIRNVAGRRRVSFVVYDLTTVRGAGQVFQNVQFSSLGHDISGLVDVYGVLEDQEHLVATGINWNNAPGVMNTPTPALDTDVVLDLADLSDVLVEFTTPAMLVREATPVSQALAEFLDSDTDGFVAFLFAPVGGANAIVRTIEKAEGDGGVYLLGEVGGVPVKARQPDPADGAEDVWRDAGLSWIPGTNAATHDVYFGTSFDDVNAASVADPRGVLVSQGQDTTYDPPGHLEFGQTYYWRVDEVNAPPDSTVFTGDVWSFTVEPLARRIENIVATASSSDTVGGPENTVNGSGLDADDLHGTQDTTMWVSGKDAEQPTWIQFEFDGVYKLREMWVWNYNMSVEAILGLGFKDVTIEYSADGIDWTLLGEQEFARGAAGAGYAHNTTVDFGGVTAKFVKLTVKSNWGGFVQQYGLSEVQFFCIPVQARQPAPASGATDVDPGTAVLSWLPGREAASHQVCLSTDSNAVADGTAPMVATIQAQYVPSSLEMGQTYYWKVVEINEAEIPAAWDSAVWSFTTLQYVPIDDFESYTNDSPNRVFQTWIDGLGFSPDEFFPSGDPGNGTGAIIGYDPAVGNIMETSIIHGGKQSMPLAYDNTSTTVSEAQRTWPTAQNWTANGADTLRLYFRGTPVGFLETADGHILMNGMGADIYASPDEGRFVYKQLSGNGTLVARVERIDETDPWAKACVMIRRSLDATAPWAMAVYAPGNGFRFQTRATVGGAGASDTTVATAEQIAVRAPIWIKIERVGNQFNAYYATADAPDTWIASPWGAQTIEMADPVYIGLAVTSHVATAVTQAEFSNVSTTGNVTGQWQSADLGIEQPAGNVSDPLYVTLEDTSSGKATVVNANPNAVGMGLWTPWEIPLTEFSSRGVKTDSIKKMTIGIGDSTKAASGATGEIYIDDIGYGRQQN